MRRYWILALWVSPIAPYFWAGTRPDRYQIDVLGMPTTYPWSGIVTVIAITTIESLVLYTIIRPNTYQHSWKRALIGLTLFVPWLVGNAVLLIHSPLYMLLHFLWLLLVIVSLLGLLIVSAVRTVMWPDRNLNRPGLPNE